jgi:endonuclease/exonuclease/phosphatase family metal-dependent hydrolase
MTEMGEGGFRRVPTRPWSRDFVRVLSWNIERGRQFSKILEFLASMKADLLLLQEVDLNARRTGYRDIASDLAQALDFNHVFGMEFQELGEGSGARPAHHGMATLSPWPLSRPRIIRFRDQSSFWKPHWYVPDLPVFQRRLGGRVALVAEATVYGRQVVTYNLHLESRGSDELRVRQLKEVLADARQHKGRRVFIGGDFNLNAGAGDAAMALREAGFSDAVGLPGRATSVQDGLLHHARPIDWIFSSEAATSRGEVHDDIRASDHYPVSAVFAKA